MSCIGSEWPVDVESSLAVVRNRELLSLAANNGTSTGELLTGQRFLDAAHILVDAQLDGSIANQIAEPLDTGELTETAFAHVHEAVAISRWRPGPTFETASSIIAARPTFDWLCHERLDVPMDIDIVADRQLELLHGSVAERWEHLMRILYRSPLDDQPIVENQLPFGHLFESVVLAMISESDAFRSANITAVPASPPLEVLSEDNGNPVDIALMKTDAQQATFVGGIQCKGLRGSSSKRNAPSESDTSVYLYARQRFKLCGARLSGIIGTWLEGSDSKVEYMHDQLMVTISQSGNAALKDLLGLADGRIKINMPKNYPE